MKEIEFTRDKQQLGAQYVPRYFVKRKKERRKNESNKRKKQENCQHYYKKCNKI